MIELSNYEIAHLLSYWIDWTFRPEILNKISSEILDRIIAEYNDYEFDTEFSKDIWKEAWLIYFDNLNKLTDDIEEAIENL